MRYLGTVTSMAGTQAKPTPKYVQLINALRERIGDGTYKPGAALPSENQLSAEFGVARATVLKSLQALKQDGWIESHQGKANFVRGRPTARRTMPAHAKAALGTPTGAVEQLTVLAEPSVAAVLGIAVGAAVYRRSHRVAGSGDLVTVHLPVENVPGLGFVDGSLLAHLSTRRAIRADYAVESTTLRRPTPDEADLLDVDEDDPVLVVTIVAYTAAGAPVLVSTLVRTGHAAGIESSYPLEQGL